MHNTCIKIRVLKKNFYYMIYYFQIKYYNKTNLIILINITSVLNFEK